MCANSSHRQNHQHQSWTLKTDAPNPNKKLHASVDQRFCWWYRLHALYALGMIPTKVENACSIYWYLHQSVYT